ncbi:MAG: class I SAM-dependent methyltransferase [Williamsia sp.]|nr:class I SAM-dependent methyltransferase [Williamsia sp.]
MLKLYNELATDWYELLTPLHGYEEEALAYHAVFQQSGEPPHTILELGSGAGHNAFFMKQWYKLTLSDLSDDMLRISKRVNPDCEHHLGDMKTLRLGKTFDAVFIHDAIMYMVSEEELRQALQTAAVHCKRGGLILVSPDHTRENFESSTDHGGEDGKDNQSLRYLSWTYDPDPSDETYTVDYAYMLRDRKGEIRLIHDRHIEGLFPEKTWLALLQEVGFDAKPIADSFGRTNFLGVKVG